MTRSFRNCLPLLLLLGGAVGLRAVEVLPLSLRQDDTPFNLQSQRGVPISTVSNSPPGSDGRLQLSNESTGVYVAPTTNQFRSFISYGAIVAPTNQVAISNATIVRYGTNVFSPDVAAALQLPRGVSNNVLTMVLRRAQIGAPYLSRQVSFLFGSVIPVPDTDEKGLPQTNVVKEVYWLPEPYSTNGHANAPYYWSPYAGKVYAVQAGQISIRWRRASAIIGQPADYATNSANYYVLGNNYFPLLTVNYVVASSPAKPARMMFWTEGPGTDLGKRIDVPTASIGSVKVVYNTNTFPEFVNTNEVTLAQGEASVHTVTDRTLWYDGVQKKILARNQEGRVFVELLSTPEAGITNQLGYEIVDVIKSPTPEDVTVELGEQVVPPPPGSVADLFPEPVARPGSPAFAFQHSVAGSTRFEYFATRKTVNQNDYLVHWLETGEMGLRWPAQLARYQLVWPADIARYSHYVRPLADESTAKTTAVPVSTENVPVIEYQDDNDHPRAKLTEDFKFYTVLSTDFPVHRTLLRFTAGENIAFERVLSWLDVNLKTTNFVDSVATELTGWNPTNNTMTWPDEFSAPRVVTINAAVGQRLGPPPGEPGYDIGQAYLAGHIHKPGGTAFNVNAYLDPFLVGFTAANQSAIIPVNAIPGTNTLEVWWYRTNSANLAKGFKPIYWPAVIARYQLRWPADSREIVLASNDGSGPLSSLEAAGSLYIQNDPALDGYNPNEEHALLQGGQAYALRDDLNVTNNPGYSSAPYVLLQYQAADGRPTMTLFHVLREKPEAGIMFNYAVTAGTILQPPMPLPLMEKPLAPKLVGQSPLSLNNEILSWSVTSSTASSQSSYAVTNVTYQFNANGSLASVTTNTTTDRVSGGRLKTGDRFYFPPCASLVLQHEKVTGSQTNLETTWFYSTNQNATANSMDGVYSAEKPYVLRPAASLPGGLQYRYAYAGTAKFAAGDTVLIANPTLGSAWYAHVDSVDAPEVNLRFLTFHSTTEYRTNIGGGFSLSSGIISDGSIVPDGADGATALITLKTNAVAQDYQDWRLGTEKLPGGIQDPSLRTNYAAFTLQDRKGNLWVYRGPHDEADHPLLTMRFYYKTMAGFYFPGMTNNQPPVGTITPYLRFLNDAGQFEGDAVYGDLDNNRKGDTNALGIVYQPVWPTTAPVLQMAETLTLPKRGLPAMRGQSSVQIVYQQSQLQGEGDLTKPSAVLQDPTREKEFALAAAGSTTSLDAIPDSAKTQTYLGRTYFPNLPPHLSQRFFFDPNRGSRGKLVFKGEFEDEAFGEKYVQLNVLSPADLAYLKSVCADSDPRKASWDKAITNGLRTTLERFVENPQRPGTYVPAIGFDKGPAEVCDVADDDIAVDSYALTATGPGVGYVSLIAGNGLAFTPPDDPVSVKIIRVVKDLFPGEVKVITSSNPLGEKVTMQQVVDLAGQTSGYEFQWKIAAPVDGLPSPVYQSARSNLMDAGSWQHVPFPLASDGPTTIQSVTAKRIISNISDGVIAVSGIPFSSVGFQLPSFDLEFVPAQPHALTVGNAVTVRDDHDQEFPAKMVSGTDDNRVVVRLDGGLISLAKLSKVTQLYEAITPTQPQSIAFRDFVTPAGAAYSDLWLSLDLDDYLGAKIYLDGQPVVNRGLSASNTPTVTPPAGLNASLATFQLGPQLLSGGQLNGDGSTTHRVTVEFFSQALPDTVQRFSLFLDGYVPVDLTALPGSQWLDLSTNQYPDGVRAIIGTTADVRSLSDNYLIMRYRATSTNHASQGVWSLWTKPQLAEGFIKRVLAGINPFNQRTSDLFNNRVNTDASILSQAGHRWEGDVALNLSTINNFGLIEIYETVLRRGRSLSIDAGINYGPANDALLLAAGYLNDLYMMEGNEAYADASNPTIGIGTKDHTYGDIATALFAFKGQVASLLDEEMALLRGRDDVLLPGVEIAPVYNRLVWNYTRGIDAGEVIYALNYNIQENPDQSPDGIINAADAQKMFPQGHGDAYGHYLTALKGYYSLLMNTDFDWVPRIEAVLVLGQPVSVDYLDERKFAAAAAAVARTGRQIFDLQWRKDYVPGHANGWSQFGATRANSQRSVPSTRYWSTDHWAARTGAGAYLNWVVGNSLLPATDPDPNHEGIQKIDRTTVPELGEIVATAAALQTEMDNAEGGLTPLGLPDGAVAFDVNPNTIVGPDSGTHFEQIYQRAKVALNNALAAFDDAKDVTRLMRSEQDSLADFQAGVAKQELAYNNALIELYGTPYPDDVGPGKTYDSGYAGPDLIHYTYADLAEQTFGASIDPTAQYVARVDVQQFPTDYRERLYTDFNSIVSAVDPTYENTALATNYVEFVIDPHGFFGKPKTWLSKRQTPGKIQQAISDVVKARNWTVSAYADADWAKTTLDKAIQNLNSHVTVHNEIRGYQSSILAAQTALETAQYANDAFQTSIDTAKHIAIDEQEIVSESLPKFFVVGTATGGDLTSVARASAKQLSEGVVAILDGAAIVRQALIGAFALSTQIADRYTQFNNIDTREFDSQTRDEVLDINEKLSTLQGLVFPMNARLQELDDARRAYTALVAQGDRLQEERQQFRRRAAAIVQGFRTRDAAFRLFRNEKLERYKTLFDLAAQYAFLAANAFDYETGLLNTDSGRRFINRIVSARALGVVRDGEPQYAGSDTGDPGLSSALAEMKADWDAVRGRLGFNNPDAYGTTVSLRSENNRVLPTTNGLANWQDVMQRSRKDNLLEDPDVRRYCLQIDPGNGAAVPGLIFEFSTVIESGFNLFGQPLAAGDHAFSPSSFATKIFAVGVALEGYRGMDAPAANNLGGTNSPTDPPVWFLDPLALSATPYVYLIPVGLDSMRTPPLGDTSAIRSWNVDDVAIPMPFNLGASDFSTLQLYQSDDSLTEPLFSIRKHPAFRPVPSASYFSTSLYGPGGTLQRSQYTNNRLVARSVWNSKWKLVIPANTLLNDPKAGLDRFLQTVTDIKLHFVTYSYSGN